jgi:transposase-like protein
LRAELSEASIYDLLRRIRWPNGITCPCCGQSRVTTHSKSEKTPRRRYLCLRCCFTFTDLTATPLARTNLPIGKWFACLQLLDERRTPTDLARALDVKWDTAVRLQRRLTASLCRTALFRQLRDALEEAPVARDESWQPPGPHEGGTTRVRRGR